MKIAECPVTQVEVRVAAPPETVWSWLLDVDLPARFSSEFQGGTWLDGAEPGLGARFRGRNVHPVAGEWETTSYVVGFEPARLFAWVVEDLENPAASWRFELEPDGEGTILRQHAQLGPGPSNLTRIAARMPGQEDALVEMRLGELNQNMLATIEGIKDLAEHGVRAPAAS